MALVHLVQPCFRLLPYFSCLFCADLPGITVLLGSPFASNPRVALPSVPLKRETLGEKSENFHPQSNFVAVVELWHIRFCLKNKFQAFLRRCILHSTENAGSTIETSPPPKVGGQTDLLWKIPAGKKAQCQCAPAGAQ